VAFSKLAISVSHRSIPIITTSLHVRSMRSIGARVVLFWYNRLGAGDSAADTKKEFASGN
jgi:hypothetical protein